jgi:hypothetical protein
MYRLGTGGEFGIDSPGRAGGVLRIGLSLKNLALDRFIETEPE